MGGSKARGKDRMYISAKEWAMEGGGFKDKGQMPFRKLPFNCCAISFTVFEDPVCTADGTVFDIVNVVPYVQKFGKHPVTGEPLKLGDLIRLNFHKNGDGEYCCPVMGKVFTDHTHIVAVKQSGNVYCWEAVDELNVKAKNWRDLLSDEPFTKKDIIHIQDPRNVAVRVLDNFDHVKKGLDARDDAAQEHNVNLAGVSDDMRRTLAAIGAQTEAKPVSAQEKKAAAKRALEEAEKGVTERRAAGKQAGTSAGTGAARKDVVKPEGQRPLVVSDPRLKAPERKVEITWRPGAATWNTDEQAGDGKKEPSRLQKLLAEKRPQLLVESNLTTGAVSKSFASTAVTVATDDTRVLKRKTRRVKKHGYVRLQTNVGDLNLELNCATVPRTCENFLTLCGVGYYNGVVFHRSIKNFMIQGGDPTGTGTGGESIYGPKFQDEFDVSLKHVGRGVLSMANSGPHTNGSQFFITYKSAPHLDGKHSVFGRVVGGIETLSRMEAIPTDDDDRPLQEIKIIKAEVFVDPFLEQEEEERKAKEEKERQAHIKATDVKGAWFSTGRAFDEGAASGGVGARAVAASGGIGAGALAAAAKAAEAYAQPAKKQKKAGGFGNFDGW